MEAFSPSRTCPPLQSFPTCSIFNSLSIINCKGSSDIYSIGEKTLQQLTSSVGIEHNWRHLVDQITYFFCVLALARPAFIFPLKQFPSKVDLYAKKHVLPLKSSCFVHRVAFEWARVRKAYSVNALTELQLGSKIRGICFYSVTAIAAIFLFMVMVVLHPFVLLFDQYRRKAHHMVAMVWSSLTVYPFINVEFEGLENLPPNDTPAVYVSNHQSFLDICTLLTLGRSFKFISKTGIFVFTIIGWAMFLLGVILLRQMDSRGHLDCFQRCMDLVRKGASIFFISRGHSK